MSELSAAGLGQKRAAFIRKAASAFDRMFGSDGQNGLVTFDQREQRACDLTDELARLLLDEHIASDPAAQVQEGPCPQCGGPTRYKGSEPREVQTLRGPVQFPRTKVWCPKCRRIFFLLDERLNLRSEDYSPAVLAKIEFAGSDSRSFPAAAASLWRLAGLGISDQHVLRITERLGNERGQEHQRQVEQFKADQLAPTHRQPPAIAAIHVDAGKTQLRADDAGPGVHQPHWSDTKVACLETYPPKSDDRDPRPQPPAVFLDPPAVMRLCQEIEQVRSDASTRPTAAKTHPPAIEQAAATTRPRRLVRTAIATMQTAEGFGWQVAAEAQRRGFYQAGRRAVVGDGGNWIGPLGDEHFEGFQQILDFVHLVVHLYAAATAAFHGQGKLAWRLYERMLRAAWAGQVQTVIQLLREQSERIGLPPTDARPNDPRRIVALTLAYVGNNAHRMNYPQYRREGLPVTSAAVESLVKQFNQRIKGTEKFWLRGGVEAVLHVRAAYLSEDGRADEFHARRPRGRAVGQHRLGRAA